MQMESSSTTLHRDDQKHNWQETISQIIPILIKNILLIAFGMTLGYPTFLIPSLSNPNSNIYLNEDQISWIGSINMISLPFGCVVSGITSQAIGRRLTMQISSILLILCWLTFKFCNDAWQIYVALFVSGFTGGLLESPVLTYVAEITGPRLRGPLLSTGPLSVTLGIFFEFLLGSALHWRNVALFSAIPPLLSFCALFFVPESPCWLIMKNRLEDARRSLSWVRGWTTVENIEQEFQEILLNSSVKPIFKQENYLKMQFLHPFFLICFLFLYYNFSGLVTIPVYAIMIFKSLHLPLDEYNATVMLGLAQVLGCLTCVVVLPHMGKRFLAFVAILIATVSLTIAATFAFLLNTKQISAAHENRVGDFSQQSWIPLIFILITAFSLNCGVRTLCWGLVAEVFPMETRSVATGGLGAFSYCLGFSSSKTFLKAVAWLTLAGVFWLYAIIGLVSLVIIYFWLPETEGKTLQDITNHFAGKVKLSKKVGKSVRKNEGVGG